MQQNNVRVIKAAKPIGQIINSSQKTRVAAYCRVSTDGEEQLNSFSSQVSYYEQMISENENWEYVGIYSDEAVTGTKVTARDGFQKMIVACMEGKIDMVITKSISRFARNTVDTLNFVRKLKNYNVAVYFEEENINTLTMDGELLLTILSSVAQQEVQNTSEHVKKGLKMKLQRGEIIGNPICLGYNYNSETKEITINEEEADIVRFIFNKYVEGYGTSRICKELRQMGCKTKKGNVRWETRTIFDVIQNEKYKGDLLFGKTVTVDPIEKRRIKNEGQEDQYYFENHHEPIVSREIWERANQIYKIKSEAAKSKPQCKGPLFIGKYVLSGKIKCGCCNGVYTRRSHLNTTTTYKDVWKCKRSVKEGSSYCRHSKAIDEAAIKKGFVQALNMLLNSDTGVLNSFIKSIEESSIIEEFNTNLNRISSEIKVYETRKSKLLDAMIDGTITKDEYNKKIIEINENIASLNEELLSAEEMTKKKNNIKNKLKEFKEKMESGDLFTEFDDDVFEAVIDSVLMGETNGDGTFDPYVVTYVFNLIGKNIELQNQTIIIGNFNCDYAFYSFDYDPILNTKAKKLKPFIPCKIALKF